MYAKNVICALAVVAGLAGVASAVMAHSGATGIVGERMNGMMEMARSVKQLSDAVDSSSVDQEKVENAARAIRKHAGNTMLSLFPEGSMESPSVASPLIWDEWQKFSRLAEYLYQLGDDLTRVADPAAPEEKTDGQVEPDAPLMGARLWASLDERELLGLTARITQSPIRAEGSMTSTPSLSETLSAITQTCSQCHETFRRSRP